MTKIIIKNAKDIENLNKKLRRLVAMLATLKQFALNKAADETVLTKIHWDMQVNKFSEKIIDRTYIGKIDVSHNGLVIEVHFISDYVSDSGFDVSEGREEGTSDHDVEPLSPDGWLTYIDPDTRKRVFRKFTHPSGIERLLIIENTINANKQNFQQSYEREITSKINQVLSF